MTRFFKEHYPTSKERFMIYLKLFYPMIIGSTLYALNGFVDNFMVGHIDQGGSALSAVNSWTNILMGIFVGTGAAGSVINAKYYFSKQYEKAQELYKFRLIFTISIGAIMAIIAWITPDTLIGVFLKKSENSAGIDTAYQNAVSNAQSYLKIIAISWILIAITSQTGNSLREIGHGKASMYWGYATIVTNIGLNATLMYGFGFGVEGAAYASVAARLVAWMIGIYWLLTKNTKISFKIWTIFRIRREIVKDFFSKWYLFVAFSIVTLFITFRNFFYDAGYPVDEKSTLGTGVGAMTILALSGAIMNIFTTTFSAAGSMAANVVGKELARGRTEQAVVYAKELKGFMTSVSMVLSIALSLFAIGIPYMEFLSEKQVDGTGKVIFDNISNLKQVRNALWVVCVFYPMWIWFTTSYRAASTGKKGFWFSFIDIMTSGPLQLAWAAALAYGIVPHSEFLQENFWATYSLFFISDFAKLFLMEPLFYKFPWNTPLTTMEGKQVKAELEDEISGSQIDMK